jgi:hypothetical protein
MTIYFNVYMRIRFLFLALLFSVGFSAQVVLPDQTFTVKVTQKIPGEKPVNSPQEELVILGNGVSSSFTKKEGFLAAAITNEGEDRSNLNATTFTAACTNAKHCALRWSCTINGNKIEGKAEKFFMGKLAGEYVFSGALKK